MSMIEFDITSVTTAATTLATTGGALTYYGTMFGESTSRYWIRGPVSMAPIGDACTTTPDLAENWGLYYLFDTTGGSGINIYRLATFQRGGRWFAVGDSSGAPLPIGLADKSKRLRLYYRSTNEGVHPTI